MKRDILFKLTGCIAIGGLFVFIKNGHVNLPGHGNLENKKFEETVVNHISSSLVNGGSVEFVCKYLSEDYKECNEIRFSTYIIYNVISKDGTKEKYVAHVICNKDRDKIIEWKDIDNN